LYGPKRLLSPRAETSGACPSSGVDPADTTASGTARDRGVSAADEGASGRADITPGTYR
jgi:hypothetical protein